MSDDWGLFNTAAASKCSPESNTASASMSAVKRPLTILRDPPGNNCRADELLCDLPER